jgi:hypothetical protein
VFGPKTAVCAINFAGHQWQLVCSEASHHMFETLLARFSEPQSLLMLGTLLTVTSAFVRRVRVPAEGQRPGTQNPWSVSVRHKRDAVV